MPLKDFLHHRPEDESKSDSGNSDLSDALKQADRLFELAMGDFEARNYQMALAKLNQASRIYVAERDPEGIATCEINTAALFKKHGDYKKAIRMLENTVELCKDMQLVELEIRALLPLAMCWLHVGDRATAKKHFDRAKHLAAQVDDQELSLRVLVESQALHANYIIDADSIYDDLSRTDESSDAF